MPTFTEAQILDLAHSSTSSKGKSARTILEEASVASVDGYDVFLSYSSQESDNVILGVKNVLTAHGLTVYVDKFDDPSMTPDDVSKATAETLRGRLRQSKSLLYLHSENSNISKWMPWELGYLDGYRSKVGIFPVTKAAKSNYTGQEYLGIYPYVGHALGTTTQRRRLVIWEAPTRYAIYENWVAGKASISEHHPKPPKSNPSR